MSKDDKPLYTSGRKNVISVLYSCATRGKAIPFDADTSKEKALIIDRLTNVAEAIIKSHYFRSELISEGLSPELVEEGINYHISFLRELAE